MRAQTLAIMTEKIVFSSPNTTQEQKKQYRNLAKSLVKMQPQPFPEWMKGDYVTHMHCPCCQSVKLRKDKYGGYKSCTSCSKRKVN